MISTSDSCDIRFAAVVRHRPRSASRRHALRPRHAPPRRRRFARRRAPRAAPGRAPARRRFRRAWHRATPSGFSQATVSAAVLPFGRPPSSARGASSSSPCAAATSERAPRRARGATRRPASPFLECPSLGTCHGCAPAQPAGAEVVLQRDVAGRPAPARPDRQDSRRRQSTSPCRRGRPARRRGPSAAWSASLEGREQRCSTLAFPDAPQPPFFAARRVHSIAAPFPLDDAVASPRDLSPAMAPTIASSIASGVSPRHAWQPGREIVLDPRAELTLVLSAVFVVLTCARLAMLVALTSSCEKTAGSAHALQQARAPLET